MEVVNMRDKVENEQTGTYNMIKKQEAILQLEETTNHNTSPPPTATASPPSASASPTHDFSFTISLHPNPPSKSTQQDGQYNKYYNDHTYNDKHYHNTTTTSTTPPSEPLTAIDLSPADDIFFHGHLLPLHLLSHLPISPRSSTNSMDSFSLPMKDILKDQNNPIGNTSFHYHHRNTFSDFNLPSNNNVNNQPRPKSKSFSIFNRPKSKKDEKEGDHNEDPKAKKKLKLEVTQLIKRYMKMVRPMLSFQKANNKRSNNNNNNNTEIYNRQQPHSYSGNMVSSRRDSSLPLIRRGEFSAPASMRTSPANSGVLVASGTISPSAKSSTSDSTMEELQAAIQSAIAHCKNSIAMDDNKIIQAA